MPIIFNIVFPMFGIIFLGFSAEKINLLGTGSVKVINNFVYYLALPTLLFGAIASEPIDQITNYNFIAAFILGMLATFGISLIGFKFFNRQERMAYLSIKSLGAALPNAGFIGIPLSIAIAGNEALLPAVLASFMVFIMVGIGIFIIELDLQEEKNILKVFFKAVFIIARNPLIVAVTVGIIYSAAKLPLPKLILNFCHLFGAAATPCALFAIGQNLAHQKFCNLYELSLITSLKLILHPLLTFGLLVLFKVNPFWIMTGTLLAAMPTGAVKYMIAQRYQFYEKESSSLILLSTITSILTLTILLFVFHVAWPSLTPN